MARVEINSNLKNQIERWVWRECKNRAEFVKKTAKGNAPIRTGALRASISYDSTDDGYIIGSDLPYSGFVEYGTRKVSPSAFLRRAYASMVLAFRK